MIKEQKELPEGWVNSTLGEVCEKPQYGWTTKAIDSGDIRLLRTTDITSGLINWDKVPFCLEVPKDVDKYLLHEGDIVVSRAGSVGVSYLISKLEPSVFASYLIRFKPLIEKKYVFYFLQSPFYWSAISEKSAGIAVQNVNATKLKEINIPVAPPEQQKQIVAKIEELFSHIDAGIESLKIAKEKLKQYRQSILKAAVTGELTKDWREQNADKIEPASQLLQRILKERQQRWEQQQLEQFQAKGKPPKNDKWKEKYKNPERLLGNDFFEIPESWELINFDSVIVSGPQNGIYLPKSKYGQGIPILRIDDFQDGYVKPFAELQKVSATDVEIEVYEVSVNDLIINRVNSMTHLGKCMIIKDSYVPAVFESNMMKLSLSSFVSMRYFELFINSRLGREELIKNAKQAVNQASINQQDVKNTKIGLPSQEEQKEIVQRVEEKLTAADRLMVELDTKLTQAQQQKQTILASAFRGSLIN